MRPAAVTLLLVVLVTYSTACGAVATAPPGALVSPEPGQGTVAAQSAGPTVTVGTLPAATPRPGRPAATLTEAQLGRRVEALLAGRVGYYSVVVELAGGEARFGNRTDAPVEAASLYKLAIMVELFTERQEGSLSFDEAIAILPAHLLEDNGEQFAVGDSYPIATLLNVMITCSSNVAAAALLDRIGNERVNATMARLGLTNTAIRWMPGGSANGIAIPSPSGANGETVYNVTSAADMALLFRRLLAGEIVSAGASAEMLQLLAGQTINDRLPALLPRGAVVAHKTGNLPGLYHDVGVVYTPAGPAVVAVLTEETDEYEAVGFMAQLGVLVYGDVP